MADDNKKNSQHKSPVFVPSPKQVSFLEAYLDPDVKPSIMKICELAGIDKTSYYKWIKDEEFCAWFLGQLEKHRAHVGAHLQKIGIDMAKKDYRYWADMMRRLGLLEGQLESGMERAGRGAMEEIAKLMYGGGEKDDES